MAQIQTIQIERMGYGAEAIGHLDSGKTVFVQGAVPGDLAEVRITEDKKTFARAVVESIVNPSPERAKGWQAMALDPVMHAVAPWAQLSYEAQLAAKQANVESALIRTAHLDEARVAKILEPIVPSPQQWGYRNKLELAAQPDKSGRIQLGFHESGSNAFVAAKECKLGNSALAKAPKALAGALRYLGGGSDLGIYRVGMRASERTQSVEVALWTPPSSFPRNFAAKVLVDAVRATSVVRVIADKGASRKVKRVEVLDGQGFWRERLDGFDFAVSAPSFFQVNTQQAETLVTAALEAIDPKPGLVVADLCSGVGTFSLPLAKAGADVIAVELEGSASRDFRMNVEDNQVGAEMICDDITRVLPELGALDAVVVDPPRAGLHEGAIAHIAAAAPSTVAYISCDPQTLARDVARFDALGYAPTSVQPVDMFPQTYHVETVCVLARR